MQHTIVPGMKIESLTADETRDLIRQEFRTEVKQRVRAEGTGKADNNGTVTVDVYAVPVGFEFELRRINLACDGGYSWGKVIPDGGGAGSTTIVPIEYLRSGESICRAEVDKYFDTAAPTEQTWYLFPHVETWGDQQGPYLRNGEILQVAFRALNNLISGGVGLNVQVTAEGLLRRPPPIRG
jgi:hypothetical protein